MRMRVTGERPRSRRASGSGAIDRRAAEIEQARAARGRGDRALERLERFGDLLVGRAAEHRAHRITHATRALDLEHERQAVRRFADHHRGVGARGEILARPDVQGRAFLGDRHQDRLHVPTVPRVVGFASCAS